MSNEGATPERAALIERAAQAICETTGSGRMFPWNTLSEQEKDAWRRMADAAFDVLIDAWAPPF
ncbi:hypothetical protein SEA_GALACTIC_88 [Mycobacterium phage Galactic]|uniref:Uncharacterized protein n=2 Tax=Cheoctovirus TaxID=1623281 RepID=A0A385UC67_9CAUD|nr:hypothetical protein FDI13_gp094 [Mycobacterium phage Spartacus]YP_009957491.1 hypothetical protein I5H41_gp088 [Mycobacterium phage Galactic]AFA45102.1 hypothetical protein SPARTACUS_94 [Mycobacterium phage Spartacus]AYB69322.1 hypothetical protein SEA_GALACTIC_88 [Mycobacterium phage Galactic]QHB47374.1 hypothetical protein SEA_HEGEDECHWINU_88 [Mycobacterium phage Hegedechwinu]